MKETVSDLLQSALAALQADGTLPADQSFTPQVGNTKDKSHGDYACNIALVASKAAGCAPRKLAEALIENLPESSAVEKVEIAGPGFINFFMSTASAFEVVNTILDEGDRFGRNNQGQGEKVQVEFVSANPTGPLHVGHGRGAAIGDCLCRLLEANGYDVTREFYYNDAGAQIDNLALSVQSRVKGLTPDDESWPADGYRGDYIVDVAKAYLADATVEIAKGVPITYNDPDLTATSQPSLQEVAGAENVHLIKAITGAEDFSFYQENIPGFFYVLGGKDPNAGPDEHFPHHTTDFKIDDRGLQLGVKAMTEIALDYLDRSK